MHLIGCFDRSGVGEAVRKQSAFSYFRHVLTKVANARSAFIISPTRWFTVVVHCHPSRSRAFDEFPVMVPCKKDHDCDRVSSCTGLALSAEQHIEGLGQVMGI